MCGIVGVWNKGGGPALKPALLERMSDELRHRGPDDAGLMCRESFGVAHRRLSIIDLSTAGKQPMVSPDGRYTLVFNGEIYNYQELAETELAGVVWRSQSDTEVLLHMLIVFGEAGIEKLRGMFAFAFWDAARQTLLLGRDPFGKKPLYYVHTDDLFAFSSEVKALLLHPDVPAQPDTSLLSRYLLHEYIPAPHSGFVGVRQVPLGHVLLVDSKGAKLKSWWQPTFEPKLKLVQAEAAKRFDTLLKRAVERRLVADVPVGVLLSGGLDSTAIAWYMRQADRKSLHSFAVSFDDATYDEGSFAEQAAEELAFEHHSLTFSLDMFHDLLQEAMNLLDVPLADASFLPTLAVSRLARQHVTVVLDGDGSDELLLGYGTYEAARMAERLDFMPRGFWRWLQRGAEMLPTRHTYFSFDFKIKQFLKGLPYPLAQQQQVWLGSFSDREARELLTSRWQRTISTLFEAVDTAASEARGLASLDILTHLMIHHYLQNDILVKLDRASMGVGLEARTPFLDVDLAEFIMRLPSTLKYNKKILKDVMRGRIPNAIIDRPKHGFALPLAAWLKGPLHTWACEVLAEDKLREDGYFEPAYVARLLNEHQRGRVDHRKKLWTLLMWQLWSDRWVVGRES